MFLKPKPLKLPKGVKYICDCLIDKGYKAYIVGGAVRDCLLDKTPTDWDVATDCLPNQVEQLFVKTIPTGKKFGTITILVDGFEVQLTTLRQDSTYTDKRHPDKVEFTSDINADLARRDFTINAIAFDAETGQFVDPYGGIRDTRKRRLRAVGDAGQRFEEDPLRILRLFRFQATLGFQADRHITGSISPQLLNTISWERIRNEWTKLILAEKLAPTFEAMYKTGVLTQIVPELAECYGVMQGSQHKWDVLGHSIIAAECIAPQIELRLAALFHDLGKCSTKQEDGLGIRFHGHDKVSCELTKKILQRFRYSNEVITTTCQLVRHHMFPIHPNSTDKAIRRFASKVGKENAFALLELRRADILAMRFDAKQALLYSQVMNQRLREVLSTDNALTTKDLAITGRDLMKHFQLRQGPLIGRILTHLLEMVLDAPEMNTKESLLERAAKILKD